MRGFTEALRQEMLVSGQPVQVTCVHPGGIKTAIARNAGAVEGQRPGRAGQVLRREAGQDAARGGGRVILRAVARNKPRSVVGIDAKILDVVVRVIGPAYQRLLSRGAARIAPDRVVSRARRPLRRKISA